ncbi:hypothetical protein DFH07DRAFT_974022 [Mycena maculata]|uniref:TLC domain-containing protein n=1 Tax=Mycena maculata TaxID=230809 RepID=A0AAD7HAM9_9AGAR|nr:hypothetical protein DFH07DRAFT_974022 [Mycena maculata]
MLLRAESPIDDDHIRKFPLTSISALLPYTGLIISVVLLVLFLIKFYILELFLSQKIYGNKYTELDEVNRLGFVTHNIAGGTKIVILVLAVYPFGSVVFGRAGFHTPFTHDSIVTMGDILLVSAQMLVGTFLFELIYRTKISPISVVHHMASILVAQAAITISIFANKDSSIEFLLCTVWGAFDIICEMLPHITIIAYRVYPDSHRFLATIFRAACLTTFMGTITETLVTMYFFGELWSRWTLPFKIVTPILHLAFSAAQFHGMRIFFKLWKKQKRIIRDQRNTEKEMREENAGLDARWTTVSVVGGMAHI